MLAGPLKGLEGYIQKVDRRKGRARVKLDLYQESFHIDFGFEFMERLLERVRTTGRRVPAGPPRLKPRGRF